MSVLGIVAEYDPFHRGHLHHLRSAMDAVSPAAVLVALSGPFKQRGDPALLSPFVRAECALLSGADAVFSLPVLWTVRDAEHYALGAVGMLSSLGITHLAFGAETPDLPLLYRTADLLENSPALFRNALHSALASGKGYPAALSEAAGVCIPESASLLRSPNNILAVSYLRAIRLLGVPVTPVVIPRSGGYHADRIDPASPSAAAVRDSLLRGNWKALSALPEGSVSAVRRAFLSRQIPDFPVFDAILLEKLRSMSSLQASGLPDCAEGLDSALLKAAMCAGSRKELVAMLTTRRYSAARISRLCTYALLGITRERLENLTLPSAALLLAIKRNPSMTGSWKKSPVQVLPASEWQEKADPVDLAAWRLWAHASGLPASYPFTQKIITDGNGSFAGS